MTVNPWEHSPCLRIVTTRRITLSPRTTICLGTLSKKGSLSSKSRGLSAPLQLRTSKKCTYSIKKWQQSGTERRWSRVCSWLTYSTSSNLPLRPPQGTKRPPTLRRLRPTWTTAIWPISTWTTRCQLTASWTTSYAFRCLRSLPCCFPEPQWSSTCFLFH